MRPEELRIGNIITLVSRRRIDPDDYFFVVGIDRHGITFENREKSRSGQFDLDFDGGVFEGIPLSEEWLLKLGFVQKTAEAPGIGDYYWFENHKASLTNVYTGMYSIEGVDCVPMRFVHQLQNLYFALTGGEELKIT